MKQKIITFLTSIMLGILLGITLIMIDDNLSNMQLFMILGKMLVVFVLFTLLSTLIHELGHLLFGLLFSYSFVSFTILSLTLIKTNKGFIWRKGGLPGTAGQCLMKPKELKPTLFKTVMYNLGGVITNFIVALIFIVIDISMQSTTYTTLYIRLFYFSNLLLALSNSIPLKINGVVNDGYNVLMLYKDENSLKTINDALLVNADLSFGLLYSEINQDFLFYDENFDYNNPLLTISLLNYINSFLEKADYINAYYYLQLAHQNFTEIMPYYYLSVEADLIFFDILNNLDTKTLREKYQNFDKIVIKPSFNMGYLRAKLAYNKVVLKDENKYTQLLTLVKKALKKHPIKSDVVIGTNFLNLLFEYTNEAKSIDNDKEVLSLI